METLEVTEQSALLEEVKNFTAKVDDAIKDGKGGYIVIAVDETETGKNLFGIAHNGSYNKLVFALGNFITRPDTKALVQDAVIVSLVCGTDDEEKDF